MLLGPIRWLGRNLSSLFLAFVLAVIVWVSAVVAADPSEERVYQRPVPIEIIGQDTALMQVADIPTHVSLTLNAPRSIWNQLDDNSGLVRAWIDLSGMGKGERTIKIKTQIDLTPHRLIQVDPAEVTLTLEPLLTLDFDVQLVVTGDLALGYRKGESIVDPGQVSISGRESFVRKVVEVRASLDIEGASETVRLGASVQALDQNGNPVSGISISPQAVTLTQPVNLLGGYRNVVVKVVTTGGVAEGHWLTNLSVSPPNVTVFSTNPQLVNELPGYVETNPIDLTGVNDDFDTRAVLVLPDGVTLVGEESVLVRVSIASVVGALKLPLPLEMIGLSPEFEATFFPRTVGVYITGPLPILNNLKPAAIRVSINLTGLEPGTHQVSPVVDLLPGQVKVATILPETVEVIISLPPTSTPTPTLNPELLTGTPAITTTISITPTPVDGTPQP